MPQRIGDAHDPGMTRSEFLALAADAAAYDAVVVLWRTRRGTQPVLMPRSLGRQRRAPLVADRRPRAATLRRARSHQVRSRPV